jgi:hypothetical protein
MQSSNNQNITNHNTQDIFLRNASLAVLDVLNRRVIIDLVREGVIEKHEIPFIYNNAGTAGFMHDFFVDVPDGCKYPEFAEGNYDILPRGIVTLQNFEIKSGDITNPFVRGTFTQEEIEPLNDRKVMKAYSARMKVLPMDLKFEVKIKSDNLNKTFKIMEKIFDFYYKNEVAYFQYRGVRIPGQLRFPEMMTHDKKYSFTYDNDQNVITTFSVEFETYYPSFDDSSKMYKGNTIQQINVTKKVDGSNSTISDIYIDKDAPNIE